MPRDDLKIVASRVPAHNDESEGDLRATLGKKLREIFADFAAMQNSFPPPPDPPPFRGGTSARSQSSTPVCDVVSMRRDRARPRTGTASK
jgi:hypothetical protein